MPARFKISFPVPDDKLAVATIVVDSDTIQEDNADLTVPPQGPEDEVVSPAVAINTVSDTGTGGRQPRSLSYPDVQILPIATSTTGQADIVYRTPHTGVIFTWTEAVRGFSVGDVEVTVQSNDAGAVASLSNFKGASGSTSYTAQLNFPASGSGLVTLRIPTNVAESIATGREGPVGSRYRQFSFEFARGVIQGTPMVEIQLPAVSPYVGRTAPISFLWNIPVLNFTQSDVSFSPTGTTMSAPQRTSNANLWEATLTLPDVASATMVTVTVAANSVSSQDGVDGPVTATADTFTYETPTTATSGAPAGTTLICDTDMAVDAFNYLSSIGGSGGAAYGVTDLTKIGDNLFGVCQVRRKRDGRANELADSLESGAALFRVNLTTNACSIIKAYPSYMEASRSLVEHDGDLFFFEGSGYMYTHGFISDPIDNPRVGQVQSYDASGGTLTNHYEAWRLDLPDTSGSYYYGICAGMFAPMVSAGEKLYGIPGTGNINALQYNVNHRWLFQKNSDEPPRPTEVRWDEDRQELVNLGEWTLARPPDDFNLFGLFGEKVWVQLVRIITTTTPPQVWLVGPVVELREDFTVDSAIYGVPTASTGDSVAADVTNWPLLSFSETIEPRLEFLPTNDITAWDLLLELARLTLTIVAFQDDLIFFKSRLPVQGQLTSTLAKTANALNFTYTSVTRPFPASGTVVVESEAITYGSVGTASLGTLARGQHTTAAVSHPCNTTVTLVDHVIAEPAFATPIEDVSIESDITNVFNAIYIIGGDGFDAEGTVYEGFARYSDAASIALYGEREFRINAELLSFHQNEWETWIGTNTLAAFKDLQYLIRIELLPRFDIQVGDFVFLNVDRDDIRRIGLVVQVVYISSRDVVTVELRTITT